VGFSRHFDKLFFIHISSPKLSRLWMNVAYKSLKLISDCLSTIVRFWLWLHEIWNDVQTNSNQNRIELFSPDKWHHAAWLGCFKGVFHRSNICMSIFFLRRFGQAGRQASKLVCRWKLYPSVSTESEWDHYWDFFCSHSTIILVVFASWW